MFAQARIARNPITRIATVCACFVGLMSLMYVTPVFASTTKSEKSSLRLTTCDDDRLLAIIDKAEHSTPSTIDIRCSGTITLAAPIVIGEPDRLTIDASEAPSPGLTLSGGNGTQLFQVSSGSLDLVDLTLTDGYVQGESGQPGMDGTGGEDGIAGLDGTAGLGQGFSNSPQPGGAGQPGTMGADGGAGGDGTNGSDALGGEGGALSIASGATVTITGGAIEDSTAQGGDGGDGGDGMAGCLGGQGGYGGIGGAGGSANPGSGASGAQGGAGGDAGQSGGAGPTGAGGNGGAAGNGQGGAIYNDGTLSLTSVAFVNDQAQGGDGGSGGTISSDDCEGGTGCCSSGVNQTGESIASTSTAPLDNGDACDTQGADGSDGSGGGAGGAGGQGDPSTQGTNPGSGGNAGASSAGTDGADGGVSGTGGSGGNAEGGAIFNSGSLTLNYVAPNGTQTSWFTGNSASGGSGGTGGDGCSGGDGGFGADGSSSGGCPGTNCYGGESAVGANGGAGGDSGTAGAGGSGGDALGGSIFNSGQLTLLEGSGESCDLVPLGAGNAATGIPVRV